MAHKQSLFVEVVLLGNLFRIFVVDELLEFHELIGGIVGRVSSSGAFRSWNDIVVIVYGIAALPIIAVILPEIIRFPRVLRMFAIAFGFYVFHTLIDSISDPPTLGSVIAEEACKLLCGAFLASGSFVGFANVVWKHISAAPSPADS